MKTRSTSIWPWFASWSQISSLSGGALESGNSGPAATVNAIFRIGDHLAARLPLRMQEPADALAWLRAEATAAEELATLISVSTPTPVALGRPGRGYPLPWRVQTWLPGTDATLFDLGQSTAFAIDLAAFISSLRGADTLGRRFAGAGRGGHLPTHDAWMEVCFENSNGLLDVTRLRALWAQLRALPRVAADVMNHGDLTPPNVLVRDGRLAGVLDGGGLSAADPALDLVGAWHLLDTPAREVLRAELGCSDVQWQRGMVWAFQQAMGLVWYYTESDPTMSYWGKRTLDPR